MQTLKTPMRKDERASDDNAVAKVVDEIIAAVATDGDAAVSRYSASLDGWEPQSFRLTSDAIAASLARVPTQVLDDLVFCQEQVRTFAQAQRATMVDLEVETLPGVRLGHRHLPVASVGAYVPGGRYPMVASAHMSIVTAKVAGVERVAACTPPLGGKIPDATVAAMHLAGADEIYILGGVQAIAALALGTETIDPVDFLVGPGNAYVVEAKRRLFGKVGIDLIAGPTEILIVADEYAFEHVEIHTANPRWYLERMRNYGALFLGEATTVAYGDKTIGTNHILPTRGAARYTGGLWVGKFLKTVTFQECDEEASVLIGEICARQCRIENFEGHARSCDVRVDKYRTAVLASEDTA